MSVDPYNALITAVEPGEAKPGPLSGKRLLVKDLIDTAGIRTTYGSQIYGDHVPERTAPAVTKLLDAGAVLVGKSNLPEFAWAVMGQNPFYGTVHNPVAPGKTTGGSSSGNAAALAADLCDISLGTDTGCSIRLPSACCETVGLKPRWGSIGMEGVFPLCPTLDTLGPMATTVEDVALVWSALKDEPVPEPRLEGLTVGLLRQPPMVGDGRETEPSDLAEGWAADLERLGARVVEARVPEPSASTWPVFNHEALESHRATFPARAAEYSDVCRTKLEVGPEDDASRGRGGVPRARGVASLRARCRSLRRALLHAGAAGGGRGRARGAPALLRVPALGQPDRLGRPRDRQPAADRAARRDRARRRPRLGPRLKRKRRGATLARKS